MSHTYGDRGLGVARTWVTICLFLPLRLPWAAVRSAFRIGN